MTYIFIEYIYLNHGFWSVCILYILWIKYYLIIFILDTVNYSRLYSTFKKKVYLKYYKDSISDQFKT